MESPKKLEARADELLEWMLENTRSTEFIKRLMSVTKSLLKSIATHLLVVNS